MLEASTDSPHMHACERREEREEREAVKTNKKKEKEKQRERKKKEKKSSDTILLFSFICSPFFILFNDHFSFSDPFLPLTSAPSTSLACSVAKFEMK